MIWGFGSVVVIPQTDLSVGVLAVLLTVSGAVLRVARRTTANFCAPARQTVRVDPPNATRNWGSRSQMQKNTMILAHIASKASPWLQGAPHVPDAPQMPSQMPSQMPRRCLSDGSQMPPRCLSDALQMPFRYSKTYKINKHIKLGDCFEKYEPERAPNS